MVCDHAPKANRKVSANKMPPGRGGTPIISILFQYVLKTEKIMLDKYTAEQKKIYRIFELIKMISRGDVTIHFMAKRLNVSTRTMNRYLNLLRSLDFKIECSEKKYSITEWPKELLPFKQAA